MNRQDELGRAFAGSQLQIQIYVNRRADELSRAILAALSPSAPTGCSIRWVSPLESKRFKEYVDADFLGALGLQRLERQLLEFWPKGGPNWDALAILEKDSVAIGYLLVEAKSYVDEMTSGCAAKSAKSLAKIDAALKATKCWLGVSQDTDWKTGLYQYANRLAHLYFLREIAGVSAWLVNVCFVDDPHPNRRTGPAEWQVGMAEARKKLGLTSGVHYACDVLLTARDRDELYRP